jgi:hypothetical protein
LQKAGARHGARDRQNLQKAHDAVADMADGAYCKKNAAIQPDLMAKAGARHSKEDLAKIASVHNTLVELGAKCAD